MEAAGGQSAQAAGAAPSPAHGAAQLSVSHVLKSQALPGPSVSPLLLAAESAVSTSLSTVFCLIICKSFLERRVI